MRIKMRIRRVWRCLRVCVHHPVYFIGVTVRCGENRSRINSDRCSILPDNGSIYSKVRSFISSLIRVSIDVCLLCIRNTFIRFSQQKRRAAIRARSIYVKSKFILPRAFEMKLNELMNCIEIERERERERKQLKKRTREKVCVRERILDQISSQRDIPHCWLHYNYIYQYLMRLFIIAID